MGESTPLQKKSAALKKAIRWISETVQEHPEKAREQILREAQLRFDLSPAECEFLDANFTDMAAGRTVRVP